MDIRNDQTLKLSGLIVMIPKNCISAAPPIF
jgi:hypothetical protein